MPVIALVHLEGALHHGKVAREGAEEGEILAGQPLGLEGHAGALATANQLGVSQYAGVILGQVVVLGTSAHPGGRHGLIVGSSGQHPVVAHAGNRQFTGVVQGDGYLFASRRYAHLLEVVLHGIIALDDQCALIGQYRGSQGTQKQQGNRLFHYLLL